MNNLKMLSPKLPEAVFWDQLRLHFQLTTSIKDDLEFKHLLKDLTFNM